MGTRRRVLPPLDSRSPLLRAPSSPLDQRRRGYLLSVEIDPHRAQEVDDIGDRAGQAELLASDRYVSAAVLVCGVHDDGRR